MTEEEFEEELSFKEDDSLSRLSEEELSTFNKSIELFIKDPTDSKSIWFLTDNLIELSDSIIHVKSGYYDSFPNIISKSKSLLETAYTQCKDNTIKLLIEEDITKINDCLKRLDIPSQSLSLDNKDILVNVSGKIDLCKQYWNHTMSLTVLDSLNNIIDLIKKGTTISIIKSKIQNLKEQVNDSDMLNLLNEALEILGKEPYSYPKYQYKKNPYQPSKAPQKLVNELVKSITHRDPRMELPELWSNIATEIALVHDGKIEQPREEIEDPQVTKLFNESLQKLLNRKNEYKQKLSEVEELSNRKVELKNSKDNLAQFQKQLLIKCIDNIIQKGNE